MSKYRVVFTNGEKRELTVEADRIDSEKQGVVRLLKAGGTTVAVVPTERVLYIVEAEDC